MVITWSSLSIFRGNNDYMSRISPYSIPHSDIDMVSKVSIKSSPRELTVVELKSLQVTGNR